MLAGQVAVVADRALEQPIHQRERRHRGHVDEHLAVRRPAELCSRSRNRCGATRCSSRLEQKIASKRRPKSGSPSSTFGEGDLKAERAAKCDVALDGVDAGAARPELHQMLAVRAADVQHRSAVQIVRFTDEADRARRHEKVARAGARSRPAAAATAHARGRQPLRKIS